MNPQQSTAPAVVTPHANASPTLIAEKVRPPPTATGVGLFAVAPLPSSPYVLSPQQYAAPPAVNPHVDEKPALMLLNTRAPETATGVPLLIVVPFPSSPSTLLPQQYAAPVVVSPHVVPFCPALMAENESPPDTGTGVLLNAPEGLPSCPLPFHPQHQAAPPATRPHAWPPPPAVSG